MKRLSESVFRLEKEYGRPTKLIKATNDMQVYMCSPQQSTEGILLPVQRKVLELGPFWKTAGVCVGSLQQRVQGALESQGDPCPSLGSWGVEQQMSVSLMQRSTSGCADASDEETQDTASSSGSEGPEMGPQHQRAPARKPRTAATSEEDSITSSQPAAPASVAFSFGSRPYLTPDLTAVQCWDVINGLLTAV